MICAGAIVERIHEIEHLFDLLDKDDFLGGARDRPELKQTFDKWNMQRSRLLQVVFHAKLELGVVGRKRFHFVQWDENAIEELHMLLLERLC